MRTFIAIDFETANPKRVSACAIGYALVCDNEITETNGYLIKPVGGHAPFQSKIHGIKEEHTFDKPDFRTLLPEIQHIFNYPLVAHSLFDNQVLNALSDHFGLSLSYEYIDSVSLAKERLPNLKNHKLKTLVKHFDLPKFKHHDAAEDAISCAKVFLKLGECPAETNQVQSIDDVSVFKGIVMGILADDEVNYKEAYQLLYWLEDHLHIAEQYRKLYSKTKLFLVDDYLSKIEARDMKLMLEDVLES